MSRPVALAVAALVAMVGLAGGAGAEPPRLERNLAGSIQLDYLAVPTAPRPRDVVLDGATVEVSLKLATSYGDHLAAGVKVCVTCHGIETGMALLDVRVADPLTIRLGRFTPAFGAFPLRHDPANHRTSDKPLPYDMGRMVRYREWNHGVLPAPWVDNGVELAGAVALGARVHLDYAAYAIGGPRGDAAAADFDYKLSRTPERYYVDNNSEPSVGGRLAATIELGGSGDLLLGASAMAGRYDPDARLGFVVLGADATVQAGGVFVRAEYLVRRTELALGESPMTRFKYGPGPDGRFADFVVRDGFYAEVEVPVGRVDLIARWDGLRHLGNVLATSPLRAESLVLRYTAGGSIRLYGNLRVKTSVEAYDFSDFADAVATHVGVAGPF